MKIYSNPMESTPESLLYKLIVTVPFVIGVAGNIAALCILYYTAKRRNAKHVLLLRCLAANDLVSEMGMLIIIYIPASYSKCVVIVLLRAFGLGSGCIAFVMAVERWLALTKPFFYHQLSLIFVIVCCLHCLLRLQRRFPIETSCTLTKITRLRQNRSRNQNSNKQEIAITKSFN